MKTQSFIFMASAVLLTLLSFRGGAAAMPPASTRATSQPAVLQYVIDHERQFRQRKIDVLANVTPGTVHDEIASISGCYGASYKLKFFGLPLVSAYEAYHFDASSGKMKYYVMQGSATVSRSLGFRVAGRDRIVISWALENGEVEDVAALITVKGEQMKIAYIAQDGNLLDGGSGHREDARVRLVFTRFPCPK